MGNNWWNFIPKEGILCWVWFNVPKHSAVEVIKGYNPMADYPFLGESTAWMNARPMTIEELEGFKERIKEVDFKVENL